MWGCGGFEVAGVGEVFVFAGLSADPGDGCAVDLEFTVVAAVAFLVFHGWLLPRRLIMRLGSCLRLVRAGALGWGFRGCLGNIGCSCSRP